MIEVFSYYILCIVGSGLAGCSEAISYSRLGSEAFDWNEHIIHWTYRFWFLLLMAFTIAVPVPNFWTVITCGLGISAFHPGFYYHFRNAIDDRIYPKGFFSEPSKDNSSLVDLPLWVRIGLFILSLIFLIISI